MDAGQQSSISDGRIEKTKTYVSNKWVIPDDSIYDNLSTLVSSEDKEKISDILDMFYYFIICYSKMCFKKDANWNQKYTTFTHYKNKKKYKLGNTFDYDLANDIESHTNLLKIQRQLYKYRKEYNYMRGDKKLNTIEFDLRTEYVNTKYFTDEKKQEILDFINESLYDIIKFIAPPVKLISDDIKNKLDKYKNIKSKTRINLNPKFNSEVLKSILGSEINLNSSSSYMVEFSFSSNK